MTVLNNGNVGIGHSNPPYPLSLANTLGDKISLYGNSGANYGFGVQDYLLQIHTPAVTDDIAFGYGSSSSFNETMRIKGNGNVGIGTGTPGFPLSFPNTLGDKISLWGSSGAHYGFGIQGNLLQIHTASSASDIAFGYGSSGSFTERMRIKGNGALSINGSTGSTGQVLTSGGTGFAHWASLPNNPLYDNTFYTLGQSEQILSNSDGEVNLTGMTYTLTTTVPSKIMINYTIPFETISCVCGATSVFINIRSDGSLISSAQWDIANASHFTGSITKILDYGIGTSTLQVTGRVIGNSTRFPYSRELNIQIIPQ